MEALGAMMARVQAGATAEPWAGPELCCWSQSGGLCRGEGAGVLSPRGPWGSGPTAVVTGTVPGLRRGPLGPSSGYGGTVPYRWIPKVPRARTPEGLVPANLSSGHRTALERLTQGVLAASLPALSAHTHPASALARALPSHGSSETAAAHGGRAGLGWQLAHQADTRVTARVRAPPRSRSGWLSPSLPAPGPQPAQSR